MKSLGFKLLPLASINEPGDLQVRRGQPHVADLAASIRAGLLLHPLVVAKNGTRYEVIAGRDRFAALTMTGQKMVGCHLVEGTTTELLDATEAENLYRRPPADRTAALAARAAQVAESPALTQDASGTVSTKTRAVKAREQVAREAGVKPATVKKAQQRQRARARDSESLPALAAQPDGAVAGGEARIGPNAMPGEGVNPGTISPRIATHGVAISVEFNANVGLVLNALERADSLLQQAQAALAPLAINPVWEQARYQRLKEAAHRLAHECRVWKPASVCVYCRTPGSPTPSKHCNGCRGTGWLSVEAMEIVPPALLEGKVLPPPATKERTLKIVLEEPAAPAPPANDSPPDPTFEPIEDTDVPF